jgi:hypothetical protein
MKKIIALFVAAFPTFVFAQTKITNIDNVVEKANNIGQLIITLAISFAVIWIIVSVVWFLIKGASDEEARKKGRDSILYGVIGLFVILSIWGLVAILKGSFNTNTTRPDTEINNIKQLPIPPKVD